jgi:MoaA/NifB/PqqE/SkfB family radical SAM enzyme
MPSNQESPIVRIEPTETMISLSWMLGPRCNYDCMYCSTTNHNNTSPHPKIEKLLMAWESFYSRVAHIGLPVKIAFTGGEVTANRGFLPLLEHIRNGDYNIGQIVVSTNGSASLKYYQKLASQVDAISFSTHSEFFNEAVFFDKVIKINKLMVRPKKSVHVNVMDEPWNADRNIMYQELLAKHNISYSVTKINFSRQIRTYPLQQGVKNLGTI